MIKRKEIEIEISPDGDKISLHIKGVKGHECLDATEVLEKGIGEIIDRNYTQEYHQTPEKKAINVSFNRKK
ncbi:MAG: DUF2997 domain-containing protein [Methanothrix sp.]|jgi:hypothetical protein|nr:DUF2997 domain-containing protein [Methanothrix sp.]